MSIAMWRRARLFTALLRCARRVGTAAVCAMVTALPCTAAPASPARPETADAAAAGNFAGPYPAGDFAIGLGAEVAPSPSTAWYFADDYIATPRAGIAVTPFARATRAFDDVANSVSVEAAGRPPMLWLGAPQILRDAQMAADGRSVRAGNTDYKLAPTPKLALNRSYFDASSVRFLGSRLLTLRGELRGDTFVMRSAWPQDFALDASATLQPFAAGETAQTAVRAMMRSTDDGGAREPFAASLVHLRDGAARAWEGKPVLVIIVNGAQGDDDEAWAGHFAIGTGVAGAGGAIGDVLVNNFYSLDIVSEKGILAAPVPLDRYLADLNSGQGWYRPSLLAVAVLDDARAMLQIQDAFNRVFQQFWRHQLVYQHATMNCAGISVDTLRALGVPVAARGAASHALGWLSVPYALVKYRSLDQARIAYEYMTEDRTRLLPAAAFEEVTATLLRLAQRRTQADDGALAKSLMRHIVAIELLRVPQWPSSRKFGSWPVVTPAEYYGKVPRDPADAQIVPVPPREFPDRLRDPDLLRAPARRADLPLIVWAGLVAILAGYALRWWVRRQSG